MRRVSPGVFALELDHPQLGVLGTRMNGREALEVAYRTVCVVAADANGTSQDEQDPRLMAELFACHAKEKLT